MSVTVHEQLKPSAFTGRWCLPFSSRSSSFSCTSQNGLKRK